MVKVKVLPGKLILWMLVLLLYLPGTADAANLLAVRASGGDERVRIVFDVDALPAYNVRTMEDGRQIQLELPGTADVRSIKALPLTDDMVKNVAIVPDGGNIRVVIDLNQPAEYAVKQLQNPQRLFIDISKQYEKKTSEEMAPGLVQTTYVRRDGKGMLTAYLLDVDPSRYALRPALANGVIAGRDTVEDMSDETNALAAINASYFARNGEILGLTKIDGRIVSTTYVPRTALGIAGDGSPLIGTVTYNGTVKAKGVSLPVSGVNCERGENGLVLYNEYYDSSTGTNEYGIEYVVKSNRVIAINPANSPLVPGTVVVSAHGTAKDALAKVRVGDAMQISEDVGTPWDKVPQVLGVGPRLLANGQVNVTADQELFGSDVAAGRAPRTAVGILPNRHVLLAVVDGRQSHSIGCTLTEMAQLLKTFGAVDAVNFDGGGSSELVVGGRIVNKPSDGSERSVGSALVVCKK